MSGQNSVFKVLDKIRIGSVYGVSVEGDASLLRKGLKLTDEKGNIFELESVGMVHYSSIEDFRNHFYNHAEILLRGDVENIGKTLFLSE